MDPLISRPNSELELNGSPAVDGLKRKTSGESSSIKLLSDPDKRLKLASLACDESSKNALSVEAAAQPRREP